MMSIFDLHISPPLIFVDGWSQGSNIWGYLVGIEDALLSLSGVRAK